MKNNRLVWVVLGITMVVVFFQCMSMFWTSAFPEPHSIPLDKEFANKLINEFEGLANIRQLDDCTRYSKRMNGISIRMNELETSEEYGEYYKAVLEELSIKESDFDRLRKGLEESKLRSYCRIDGYSVFIVDGFLDSFWGYLYSHDQDYFVEEKGPLICGGYSISTSKDLGDNWYQISGFY